MRSMWNIIDDAALHYGLYQKDQGSINCQSTGEGILVE